MGKKGWFCVSQRKGSARKGSDLVYKTVLGVEKQSCVSYAVLCEQEEKHLCDLEKTCVEENCLQMCKGMEEDDRFSRQSSSACLPFN
ncbi:hypothetical protein E3N88_36617 [Mikania micrantha]|uniref:Uncharacterized protein n=1 Tax=Mikania micrantha TaxID=192012 RepID=A0A5N6M4E2_9ASTR|nr:hypothetical protein E3N88_36617 [Mikania micrantha]